jgi:hypothetical protein
VDLQSTALPLGYLAVLRPAGVAGAADHHPGEGESYREGGIDPGALRGCRTKERESGPGGVPGPASRRAGAGRLRAPAEGDLDRLAEQIEGDLLVSGSLGLGVSCEGD